MTVTAQTTKYSYIAGGSTTTFAYQCQVLVSTDLKVYANGVLQTSGYTVTGIGVVTGGSVVFSVAPAATTVITIERVLTLDRQTDYQYGGPLSEATIDADQDRQSQIDQQLNQKFTQALLAPDGEATSINLQLPSVSSRASKYLGFDALGNAITYSAGAPSGTVLASNVSYTPPGGNATTVAQYLDNRGDVSVKDFGAVGDGVTDDSAAFQAAFDYAASDTNAIKKVVAPAGRYVFGATVYIPFAAVFEGDGGQMIGGSYNTLIMQKSGFNGDCFRFVGYLYNTNYWWHGRLTGFSMIGNTANTGGFGINFKDSAGNKVFLENDSIIENIAIRKFYSGGLAFYGGLPIWFRNISFHYNKGPGITFDNVASTTFHGICFDNISGDGNVGGVIAFNNFGLRYGQITIINLKSEAFSNPDYATGTDDQMNPLVLTNCAGLQLNILGGSHICAIPDGANNKKPGSFVKINDATAPTISWSNVVIRVRPTDTGVDPGIIETTAGSASTKILYTNTHGFYAGSTAFLNLHWSANNTAYTAIGPIDAYMNGANEFPGFQVAGAAPALHLYEYDGAADSKSWDMQATGQTLRRQCINDSGVIDSFETVSRSGGSATKIAWDIPAQLPSYTVAGVPSAASMGAGAMIYVSNEAGGATLAFSDSVNWRRVADRAVIS